MKIVLIQRRTIVVPCILLRRNSGLCVLLLEEEKEKSRHANSVVGLYCNMKHNVHECADITHQLFLQSPSTKLGILMVFLQHLHLNEDTFDSTVPSILFLE